MASRELLTGPEEGLVRALADLAPEIKPRASFRDSLRDRLVAEASAIETQEAEEFDRALSGQGASAEIIELARFATALAPASVVRAPASLRNNLRDQIATPEVIIDAPVRDIRSARSARRTFGQRVSRRLAVAAALGAMMVSSSAFALAASANATPDDALYGLKRFRERAQTWFVSGIDEGVKRLGFADNRVDEAEQMLAEGVTAVAPYETAFDDLRIEIMLSSQLIIRGHEGGDGAAKDAVPALASFIQHGRSRVEAMQPDLPAPARALADEALGVFDDAAGLTEEAVGGCVICSDHSTFPPILQPTASPSPSPSTEPSATPSGSSSPAPNPEPTAGPSKPNRPGPIDKPLPDPEQPVPTTLPDPDLLPNLPGRLDDDLDSILGRTTNRLADSV